MAVLGCSLGGVNSKFSVGGTLSLVRWMHLDDRQSSFCKGGIFGLHPPVCRHRDFVEETNVLAYLPSYPKSPTSEVFDEQEMLHDGSAIFVLSEVGLHRDHATCNRVATRFEFLFHDFGERDT